MFQLLFSHLRNTLVTNLLTQIIACNPSFLINRQKYVRLQANFFTNLPLINTICQWPIPILCFNTLETFVERFDRLPS